jgi:F-box-like
VGQELEQLLDATQISKAVAKGCYLCIMSSVLFLVHYQSLIDSPAFRQLPNNPNATSNRTPEGTELASLRTMAVHKQRIVDQLIQEARVARATYEEVKRRYEVQYLALQATQSELHVANELAESLEKTVASLQSDLGQLHGLLHPLRHCPDEVLGLIFEEARRDFADAVTLSHVCRRWRAIAISSPRLWSRIDLALDLPDNAAESKVQAFLSRVSRVPATIYLCFWPDETVVNERRMTKVRIVGKTLQASRVDYLDISIEGPFEYSSILEALPTFPRHRLTSLDMTDNTDHSESQGTWTDFLSRFGSIRNLHLTGGSFGSRITRDLQSTLESILVVTLDVVYELPLTSLLQSMPNVQHFKGTDCVPPLDLEDTTTRVALPNLRSLCIYEMCKVLRKR